MKIRRRIANYFITASCLVLHARLAGAAICENDRQCFNGGECKFQATAFDHGINGYCECADGYEGKRCEDRVCDCLNGGQCVHGEALGEILCECVDGFSGTRCEKLLPTTSPISPTTAPTTGNPTPVPSLSLTSMRAQDEKMIAQHDNSI